MKSELDSAGYFSDGEIDADVVTGKNGSKTTNSQLEAHLPSIPKASKIVMAPCYRQGSNGWARTDTKTPFQTIVSALSAAFLNARAEQGQAAIAANAANAPTPTPGAAASAAPFDAADAAAPTRHTALAAGFSTLASLPRQYFFHLPNFRQPGITRVVARLVAIEALVTVFSTRGQMKLVSAGAIGVNFLKLERPSGRPPLKRQRQSDAEDELAPKQREVGIGEEAPTNSQTHLQSETSK
ncbi:hypothetical protein F5Y18DRAFT_424758 [Xylariaceae sp. FL1019]|nr:hypothetical protein F5Y18DRAFT_424758 [Xylariaceae sp. FL1019]